MRIGPAEHLSDLKLMKKKKKNYQIRFAKPRRLTITVKRHTGSNKFERTHLLLQFAQSTFTLLESVTVFLDIYFGIRYLSVHRIALRLGRRVRINQKKSSVNDNRAAQTGYKYIKQSLRLLQVKCVYFFCSRILSRKKIFEYAYFFFYIQQFLANRF